jgi:hypothetical protein
LVFEKEKKTMTEFLFQGTYSSYTWVYRMTKDPADFTRPPDLLGVFQEVGAKFLGVWYAFGEYDFAAIMEVPDNVDVAALAIAARAGWDGKAFDKICITPLLNQQDAAAACDRAAKGLAKSRDATKQGPLLGSTMDFRNADFSQGGKEGWTQEHA